MGFIAVAQERVRLDCEQQEAVTQSDDWYAAILVCIHPRQYGVTVTSPTVTIYMTITPIPARWGDGVT